MRDDVRAYLNAHKSPESEEKASAFWEGCPDVDNLTMLEWPAPDYWCTICNRGAEACMHTPADAQ